MSKMITLLSLSFLLITCSGENGTTYHVRDIDELNTAISAAGPGDKIIMANGIWKDVEIQFEAQGTAEGPIHLMAETAGEVYLEGQSSLELAGEYLIVDGLYFRNGFTPSNSVIEFRIDDDRIANHSKVVNCVIDGYTQKNRFTPDHWVEFWGRHNTLEYSTLTGKANRGPTVRVFLKGNEHIRNYHRIAHNYFGPRPRKGGPRAETMQIGDSGTSMTPSYVFVEDNLFDRCNGEVEVISSQYCERPEVGRRIAASIEKNRFSKQFEPSGAQPEELKRTKSFSYSVFNLEALVRVAVLSENYGVDLSLNEKSTSILKQGIDFLLPYTLGEEEWKHDQISSMDGPNQKMIFLLTYAQSKWSQDRYSKALKQLVQEFPDSRFIMTTDVIEHSRSGEKLEVKI